MTQTTIIIETVGPGFYEFTDRAQAFIRDMRATVGLIVAFARHTSCSLLIQENVSPEALRDLDAFFRRLVPPADDPAMDYLAHWQEGVDGMPAHIKSALTGVSLTVPFTTGRLSLGAWQGLYLWEHRREPVRREIVLHVQT